MKTQIPDELKADIPPTPWGKILSATPVVMAVVATLLAGLASSEMTRAQYDRALAAQQQSKAGDQWSFFQAKKLRGALQHNTLDIVISTAEVRPLDVASIRQAAQQLPADAATLKSSILTLLDSKEGQQALAAVQKLQLPQIAGAAPLDPSLIAVLEAIETSKIDAETKPLVAAVKDDVVAQTLREAKLRAQEFDAAIKPCSQALDLLEKLSDASAAARRDLTAARLRFNSQRYDAEARLNQMIANLYEVQVRRSNLSAERHHIRSQRFFVGMLCAQTAVIVSTLALAARNRNLLWSVAAVAGITAIAFAIYVYFSI